MNYTIRKSNERAYFDHGWLKTYHTFSFGNFHDPKHTNFRALRVINEDQVLPGNGFPSHAHRNMEIITYVLSGQLAHKDSLANVSILKAGELQVMHAGTGITHSEYNPSATEPVHFLQIWLTPDTQGVEAGYQQTSPNLKVNDWTLTASKDAKNGSLPIHQDTKIFLADMPQEATLPITIDQFGWLQVINGSFMLNDTAIDHGDGVAFEAPASYTLKATTPGKVLLFLLT